MRFLSCPYSSLAKHVAASGANPSSAVLAIYHLRTATVNQLLFEYSCASTYLNFLLTVEVSRNNHLVIHIDKLLISGKFGWETQGEDFIGTPHSQTVKSVTLLCQAEAPSTAEQKGWGVQKSSCIALPSKGTIYFIAFKSTSRTSMLKLLLQG